MRRIIVPLIISILIFTLFSCTDEEQVVPVEESVAQSDEAGLLQLLCGETPVVMKIETMKILRKKYREESLENPEAFRDCVSNTILTSENDELLNESLITFSFEDPMPLELKERLIELLGHDDARFRRQVLIALLKVDKSDEVLRAVESMLDDEDPEVRIMVVDSLTEFGSAASGSIDKIIGMLDDTEGFHWQVRYHCITVLGYLGHYDEKAMLPVIEILAEDSDAFARQRAASALRPITSMPGVLDALIVALDDDDPGVRGEAANTIGMMGEGAKSVLPKFEEMLENEEVPEVLDYVRNAIGWIKSGTALVDQYWKDE